jgi:integrase
MYAVRVPYESVWTPMPRTRQDKRLDTRSARLQLPKRREPYWRSISEGMAVGYRRGSKGGTWVAKQYAPAVGRRVKALGTADDIVDADGVHVLSFAQAQEAARAWFTELAVQDSGGPRGPYKVKQACDDYVDFLRAEKRTAADTERRLKLHVIPKFGDHAVADLKTADIEAWKRGMVRREEDDPDAERRSKDTANRVLTMLKAALNRAFNDPEKHIASDIAWRRVKPFPKVARRWEAHLDQTQSRRLVNTISGAFRKLVTAALLTGARPPGELSTLRVKNFRADLQVLSIVDGKTGPRDVVLTAEAVAYFRSICAGKKPDDLLLPKEDGGAWGYNHHLRPMRDAVTRAKLPKGTTIYALRHTYASQSIMAGMNLKLLAENMGTSIRMLETNYGKFIKAAKRQMVEESAFKLGLKKSNIVSIDKAARK